MKTGKYHKKRWLIQAVIGLILIGMGMCFVVEAAFIKHDSNTNQNWVLLGTGALIVFNSGISIFVDAAIHKVKYDSLR